MYLVQLSLSLDIDDLCKIQRNISPDTTYGAKNTFTPIISMTEL